MRLRGGPGSKGKMMINSMRFMKISIALGAGLFLTACAGNYDIAKVSAMAPSGDAFTQALHKHYGERATFEKGEGDWRSVNFFNTKALTAAGGTVPPLQAPSERALKVDGDYINAAHARLTKALASNAPSASPDACALSQVWLEHWMEQSAEGHQPGHIAAARGAYERAIPDCVGTVPAPVAHMPDGFIVYFDFNSAQLNADGAAVVAQVVSFLKAHPGKSISLMGHTDRAGDSAYNTRLAEKRVETVRAALAASGVGAVRAAAGHGENRLSVMTADGVKNAMNRRVEINVLN